jgi:hypothetical protein
LKIPEGRADNKRKKEYKGVSIRNHPSGRKQALTCGEICTGSLSIKKLRTFGLRRWHRSCYLSLAHPNLRRKGEKGQKTPSMRGARRNPHKNRHRTQEYGEV